jgi:hypothetical protein
MKLCRPLSRLNLLDAKSDIDQKILAFSQCGLCNTDIKPDNMCFGTTNNDVLFLDMDPASISVISPELQDTAYKYMRLQFWAIYNSRRTRHRPTNGNVSVFERIETNIFGDPEEIDDFCTKMIEMEATILSQVQAPESYPESASESYPESAPESYKEGIKSAGRKRNKIILPIQSLAHYMRIPLPIDIDGIKQLVLYALSDIQI